MGSPTRRFTGRARDSASFGRLLFALALLPQVAWCQSDANLAFERPLTHTAHSQSPLGMDMPLDELVQRLLDAEQRLATLEAEREQLLGAVNEATYVSELMRADEKAKKEEKEEEEKPKAWYEKYGLRGYSQFRLNETLSTETGSAPAQHVGDASVGDDRSFLIRRARIIIFGDVTDRISIYLQPDFAGTPPGSPDANQFVQIRDWYADLHLDDDKVHRFRVGQSKIPYGWENLQSSMNRLPLDRNDAFNSAARNERDLGVFYYWTPEYAQDIFKFVNDEGLKGSGNYGVFGIGVYNGQGGSFQEQNENVHAITRLTIPWTMPSGQIIEAGMQAYTGRYTVLSSTISPLGVGPAVLPAGTLETGNIQGHLDERFGLTCVHYAQPIGFQAEWTTGRGPALNDAQTAVINRPLHGGYVMMMYRWETPYYGEFWPFIRWQTYDGGYKSERNAPYSTIDEFELGLEWQINKNLEFVSMYTVTDRTNTRANSAADTVSYEQFEGQLARFQLQVNY